MSQLSFFKGLTLGLCLSAMMWWGVYKIVDVLFLENNIAQVEQTEEIVSSQAIVTLEQATH